jgi:hypothetical protein
MVKNTRNTNLTLNKETLRRLKVKSAIKTGMPKTGGGSCDGCTGNCDPDTSVMGCNPTAPSEYH